MADEKKESYYSKLNESERKDVDQFLELSKKGWATTPHIDKARLASLIVETREDHAASLLLKRGDGMVVEMHGTLVAKLGDLIVGSNEDKAYISIGEGKGSLKDKAGMQASPNGVVLKHKQGEETLIGFDCDASTQIRQAVATILKDKKLTLQEAGDMEKLVSSTPNPKGKKNQCER